MFAVYFVLLVLPLISAQVIGKGSCPIPHVQQDFNIHAYLGTWYELARIPSFLSEGKCVTAEYKMEKGNSYLYARHAQFINGKFSSKTALMRVRERREPAKLEIKFLQNQPFLPYWVLYTDYETYAVVYTCENHHDSHSQYVWVIGRRPQLNLNTLHGIIRALLNQGIYGNKLELTDQSCYLKTH